MKTEEVKQDNEVIAEFMGWSVCDCGIGSKHYKYDVLNWQTHAVNEMKFCESWDWLMPVVDKIFSLWESMPPSEEYLRVTMLPIYSDIKVVYRRVVEFIHWYNKQKNI